MRRRRGPDPHTGTTGTRATATTPAGEDPRLQTLVKRGEAYITFRRERFVLHSRRNQKTHSGLYLNEIYVPPADRGKGIAGEMLQSILKLADTHRTTLFLEPREADGLTEKQLVQWYERHGFKRATSNLYMRTPESSPKDPLLTAIAHWLNRRTRRGVRREPEQGSGGSAAGS